MISVLILHDARFPLKLGGVNTIGRAGLWITSLPGLLGIVALVLVLSRAGVGAPLLAIYSLFWAGVLASGLPAIWNARTSFCTRTFCITTPWITRLLALALITAFLLVALWAYREAARRDRVASPA